ncbi:hypothetical protein [Streptomyces fodineus]|uniref:hypothetical protein n=1 Tax=Streptomyces fodineus TaxID=1904616 RepID=UPI00131AB315|nr:hypothetical protein [Streptomyces fodineus]
MLWQRGYESDVAVPLITAASAVTAGVAGSRTWTAGSALEGTRWSVVMAVASL